MKKIEDLLRSLGIGMTYAGYHIMIAAVNLALENQDRLRFITKELYPMAAKRCNCSVFSAERNIRTVAKKAWERNPELLIKLAGYPMDSPPTASEFISILTTVLLRKKA